MNKLAIFINPSPSYLYDKVKETYQSWGYESGDMIRIEKWYKDAPFQSSLFKPTFVLLDLTRDVDFKAFKQFVDEDKKFTYFKSSNWYGSGVIIIAHSATGKWLDKIAEYSQGYIERAVNIHEIKKELVQEFKLPYEHTQIILDVIGEDYSVYSIVKNTLSKLDKSILRKLTTEELFSHLPIKKGTVLPWSLLTSIFQQDSERAVQEFDRIKINTHPFVLLTLIKNKFTMFYKYVVLKRLGCYKRDDEICSLLGLKNAYALKDFTKFAHKIKLSTLEYCLKMIFKLEDEVKGGTYIPRRIEDTKYKELILKLIFSLQTNSEI